MQFSKKIQACELSPIRKFYPYADAAKKQGKRIYQLNIGQPDVATPKAFYDAVQGFVQPVLAYAPSGGLPVLVEAVRAYYAGIGVSFEFDDILVTTGGSEALEIVLSCILDDGDEIIVPEPFYPNYNTFTRVTGGRIHPLETKPEEGYRYAVREKIEAAINEHTRALLISNPGNPTGTVLSKQELRLLADIAKEHNLFLIGDEVYREFVYGGEPLTSIGEFTDIAENAIIIDSVSKRFSACGARIGTLITRNKELQQHAMKICQARLSVATLDQIASAALYSVGSDYFTAVRAEYRLRRDTIYQKLMAIPGVVCSEPKGAFYVMAKLPVEDAEDFQTWLLQEFDDNGETVMFAPGAGFYATPGRGRNEVRLAYVLKQKDLERAMDLLALGILEYQKRKR
ncbi:MAG: pyridoxal phosphate-dependent aminotransferase [Clostridiaceae bacterium]